jgi:hypothetical protein
MKYIRWIIFFSAVLVTAIVARGCSTGVKIIGTGGDYLRALDEGDLTLAHSLLSDSLGQLLEAEALAPLENRGVPGGIRAGRYESRGFSVSLLDDGGGSRTLWLRSGPEGSWQISGDTSIDNILGNAAMLCSSFARTDVIPGISAGGSAGDYRCPISGRSYEIDDGRLVCPAGHLGPGLDLEGRTCSHLRDSLATVLEQYLVEGYPFPEDFTEMHENSNGVFGQPGGFRCPDHGYSYYQIRVDGIYCPFHDQLSPISDSLAIIPEDVGEESEE